MYSFCAILFPSQSREPSNSSHTIQPRRPRRPSRTWQSIHLLIIVFIVSLVFLTYPGAIAIPLTSMSSAAWKTRHIRYHAVSGKMVSVQFIGRPDIRYPTG